MSLAVFLNLSGESALVVGGGKVALRRTRTLLLAGLRVRVVAPDILPELGALEITPQRRAFQETDLQGVRLVVAATNQAAVNDAVVQSARRAGLLANHAGEAERGNLRFPALAERAGVQVAVQTGRELPMLSQVLTQEIAALLPSAEQLAQWQRQREQALALAGQERELALMALKSNIQTAIAGAA